MIGALKHKDWLAAVVYPLVVVLMESFWIFPWIVWLGNLPAIDQIRPPLGMPSVISVLAVALAVTRIFHGRQWRLGFIRVAIIVSGMVIMLLVLRFEYGNGYGLFDSGWGVHVVRMVVIVFLLWRGILLGRTTVHFNNIFRSFLFGIAALIILIILWRIGPGDGIGKAALPTVGFYTLGFFLFGLTALAIRNIYTMRRRMAKRETKTSVWRTLPLILGVIGGIVIIAVIAATLFSPEFLSLVMKGFRFLWELFTKLAHYLAIPLTYAAAALFWLLKWLVNLIRRSEAQEVMGIQGSPLDEIERESGEMPQIITTVFEAVAIAAIVAAAVLILAKAIKRFQAARDGETTDEIHESLWSREGFKADLKQFLKTMGSKFRRGSKPAYVHYDDEIGDLGIREIYKRLLWEADRSGVTRLSYETPSEYARRLETRLSGGKDHLAEITLHYSNVRYGEIDPTDEQVDRVNGLWGKLRTGIREIREPDEITQGKNRPRKTGRTMAAHTREG